MFFQIFVRRMNRAQHSIRFTKTTNANVNTRLQSLHHKARCSNQVQATACCTVGGNLYSQSSYVDRALSLYPSKSSPQVRSAEVSGMPYDNTSKCWLCTRVSRALLHRPRYNKWTKTCINTPEIMQYTKHVSIFFTFIWSGHILGSPCLHAAEFLCPRSYILATIQSKAQKCLWLLPEIVTRSRLFRGCAWNNRGVGRV